MSDKKYENGHCSKCGSERADVLAEYKDEYHDENYDAVTYYRILECRGCGNIYFKSSSSNSEDYDHYDIGNGDWDTIYNETIHYWPPASERRPPEWVDEIQFADRVLGSLFDDVYTALDNNLGVLAAIGMRTVFDRASELLGVDAEKSFREKLDDLGNGDHITEKEKGVLSALINAGSAAAHRGWQPKPRQLDAMMTILEAFLHRAFLLEEVGAKLEEGVPKRQPRQR